MLAYSREIHWAPSRGGDTVMKKTYKTLLSRTNHSHLFNPSVLSLSSNCLKVFLFFFLLWTSFGFFLSLYWICHNIASVPWFGFLAVRPVGPWLPTQGLNPHPALEGGLPGKPPRRSPMFWSTSPVSLLLNSQWCPSVNSSYLTPSVVSKHEFLLLNPLSGVQAWILWGKKICHLKIITQMTSSCKWSRPKGLKKNLWLPP